MAREEKIPAVRMRQEAIQRDWDVIEKLMKNRSLSNDSDVLAIYSAIQTGNVHFVTEEGRKFDDEIFQRVSEIRRTQRTRAGTRESARPETVNHTSSRERAGERRSAETPEAGSIVVTEEEIREQLRLMEKRRKWLRYGLLLGAMVFLTVFLFVYAGDVSGDKEAEKLVALKDTQPLNTNKAEFTVTLHVSDSEEEVTFEVLDKYKNLYNLNKSLIGWLKIDDTIIDYPVMQTVDNSYYLTHNFEQEEDKKGSLFLDYRNDIKHFSDNMIIYGHHLRSGKMFGNLPDYQDEKFFEKHRYVQFDTLYEERTYQVMYVFRSPVYKENDINFKYYNFLEASSEAEFNSYMKEMANRSLYDTGVNAKYGDELLTLSTCDNLSRSERFVVVCKRIR